MLGPILAAGLGAITFKLGMDAQRMSDEGMGCGEIAARLPKSLYDTTAYAVGYVKDTISRLCAFGSCEDREDEDDSARSERIRVKKRNPAAKAAAGKSKKPARKPVKDAKDAKDTPRAQPAAEAEA